MTLHGSGAAVPSHARGDKDGFKLAVRFAIHDEAGHRVNRCGEPVLSDWALTYSTASQYV